MQYEMRLRSIITELIENYNVMQFYSGGRGDFDDFSSSIVGELRTQYPFIKNTLVLSYIPKEDFIRAPSATALCNFGNEQSHNR